jgi:hypothetical protein
MKAPTKKAYLAALAANGARKFYPAPHIEDTADIISNIKAQLLEQGAAESDIIIDAQKISIGSQYWNLPRHYRDGDLVKVQIRSKDIITTGASGEPCYGDIKGWQIASVDGGYCLQHVASGARLYPLA